MQTKISTFELIQEDGYLNMQTKMISIVIQDDIATITGSLDHKYQGSITIVGVQQFDGYMIRIEHGYVHSVDKKCVRESVPTTISYLLDGSSITLYFDDIDENFVAYPTTIFVDEYSGTIKVTTEFGKIETDDKQLQKILNTTLDELDISVRAYNSLRENNINKYKELAVKRPEELLKFSQFGKKSLIEVEEALANIGLSLGMKFK